MRPEWMSPERPDANAWHGDDRATDGGRLDPNTGLEVPPSQLDPPEPRPDGRLLCGDDEVSVALAPWSGPRCGPLTFTPYPLEQVRADLAALRAKGLL